MLESVVPDLASGPACTSHVELRNLGAQTVEVSLEGHVDGGALVPLEGQRGLAVRLAPGQQSTFGFGSGQGTGGGWVKVREPLSPESDAASVAISGAVECTENDVLKTVFRPVAFALRNPWFEGDTASFPGAELLIVNTEPHPASARACYSAGSFYSVPRGRGGAGEWQPVCSAVWETQLAPFASARVPLEHPGDTHFSLRTRGGAIVLQILRPLDGSTRLFTVDSTIHFEQEVHP